jgi:hypothetical protein
MVGRGSRKIEKSVSVLRANLHDGDIDRIDEPPVEVGRLAEVEGDVVAAAGIVLFAVVAGKMPIEYGSDRLADRPPIRLAA